MIYADAPYAAAPYAEGSLAAIPAEYLSGARSAAEPFGAAAAVWTADISKAHLTAKALRAGSVWVNQYDGGDMTAPFGGFKQSGNGRDKSLHAFDKYTELKATWIKL